MSQHPSSGLPAASAADLRARVLAEVARTPSPTRAVYKRRLALVAAVGALATVALFLAMGGVRPGTRPVEMIALTVGFGVASAAVLTRLSSGQGGAMLGRPRPVLLTAVAMTAPLLAVVVVCGTMAWPESAAEHVGVGTHFACGTMSVLQGALPLLVLLWPRRGSDPVHPAVTGAALGMTAGAWALVMATLRCPHAAALHGIVAHVLPTLVLTAFGAVLGGLLLRLRRES
jgi:hypothetical protein